MAKRGETDLGLLILAGVGAGTLLGAAVGLALGRRAARHDGEEIADSVDALRARAQRVLGELSESVDGLVRRSRALVEESAEREPQPSRR